MSDRPTTIIVRCLDCVRDENTPWLPLILREICPECARATVARHLQNHPSHRCSVTGTEEPA